MPIDVKHVEQALDQAKEVIAEMVRRGMLEDAMRFALDNLKTALSPLVRSLAELRESVADLRHGLEIERAQRRDEIRGLRGEVAHLGFRFTLERICAEHGLSFEPLTPDPYRVDGRIAVSYTHLTLPTKRIV